MIGYYNLDRFMWALFSMMDTTGDGLKAWMDEWVYGCKDRAAYIDHYVEKFGSDTLTPSRPSRTTRRRPIYGAAFYFQLGQGRQGVAALG